MNINIELQPLKVPKLVFRKPPKTPIETGHFSPATVFHVSEVGADKLSKMCLEYRAALFLRANRKDPLLLDKS